MALRTFVSVDEPGGWQEPSIPDRRGRGFLVKRPADGLGDRPSINFGIQPEGFKNPAHLHDEAQFQVLLQGSLTYPRHHLEAIAVHYSDANSAYGPFLVGPGLKMAALRRRKADQIYLSDPRARSVRNKYGREFYGPSSGAPWRGAPGRRTLVGSKTVDWLPEGTDGTRVKHLINQGPEGDVGAMMFKCRPGVNLSCDPAPFGAFHLLIEGSGVVDGQDVHPYSMRFVMGDETPTPLGSGASGATWMILTFDERSVTGDEPRRLADQAAGERLSTLHGAVR